MKSITPLGTIDQVFKTLYNVCSLDIFEAVYGEGYHSNYMAEKTKMIRECPATWWGTLDSEHQDRFCKFVVNRWRHQDD